MGCLFINGLDIDYKEWEESRVTLNYFGQNNWIKDVIYCEEDD